MTTQQEKDFTDIVADMFGDRVTEFGSEGFQVRMAKISNDFQISEFGDFVQQVSTGEVFNPALCNGEYYFVLPFGKGGRKIIYSAIELVFKAFTDKRYLDDLKKTPYTLYYKDGWKENPSAENIGVRFERD